MLDFFKRPNSNLKQLNTLKDFFKDGINKSSFLHIYSKENIDETLLALKIINNNNEDLFIYMDCYYNLTKKLPDNTFYLYTNNIDDLINILKEMNNNIINYIIIDGFGFLTYTEELINKYDIRYKAINNKINILLDLCYKKKITLIAFNSLNGLDKPTCFSSQIESQCNFNAQILDIKNNIITIQSYKNTYGENKKIDIIL